MPWTWKQRPSRTAVWLLAFHHPEDKEPSRLPSVHLHLHAPLTPSRRTGGCGLVHQAILAEKWTGRQLQAWPGSPFDFSPPLSPVLGTFGQGSMPRAQALHLTCFFLLLDWSVIRCKNADIALRRAEPPSIGSEEGLPSSGEVAVPDRWSG